MRQAGSAGRKDLRFRAKRALSGWLSKGLPTVTAVEDAQTARGAPLSSLLMVLTLAMLAPVVTLEAFDLQVQVQGQRAAEVARLLELAGDLVRSVDRELRGQIETAEMLSARRLLQRGDVMAFREHAGDAASPTKGHFVLVDRSLRQLVNTRALAGSALPETANPATAAEVFARGEVQVGNLQSSAFLSHLTFAVHVPVWVGGDLRYVLSYVPRQDLMREVVDGTYRPEGWFGSVFDANGRTIARSFATRSSSGGRSQPRY